MSTILFLRTTTIFLTKQVGTTKNVISKRGTNDSCPSGGVSSSALLRGPLANFHS